MNSNSKGDLIARLTTLGLGAPSFEAEATGPSHDRTFRVSVAVGGRTLGVGEGRSKKEAERAASEAALTALDQPAQPVQPTTDVAAWPIYSQVLAQAIEAALEFADDDATLADVQRDAASFYRGLLSDLGHRPQGEA